MSRETLAEDDKRCVHCDVGALAVWRCRDCSMGKPMCRGCMRKTHKENPFHRIEQWNRDFFRPAELWEVGTYLLVRHHTGAFACDVIKAQEDFLERLECRKDEAEQYLLKYTPATSSAPASTPANWNLDDDVEMSNIDSVSENLADEQYLRYLQDLKDGGDGREGGDENDTENDDDVEDGIGDEELDVPVSSHYLPKEMDAGYQTREGLGSAQRVMGTYVRVVHTNGIHVIAMVSCSCQGHDHLASDLLAARLLPASFERIRTIFTVQLLDHFRLSNLELKSSAYQFYHLLQRLTCPMDPGTVVNLYREFRRMSRIWRWMKRLKWAGFCNNNTPAIDVSPGQLAVFCPACPQPGINIPDNWKEDLARYVSKNIRNL